MSVYVDEPEISKVPVICGTGLKESTVFTRAQVWQFFTKREVSTIYSSHWQCPASQANLIIRSKKCYDRHVFPVVGSMVWQKYGRVLPCFARYFGKIVAKHLPDLEPERIPRTWRQHWQLAGASASSGDCGPKQLNFRVVSRPWPWESTARIFKLKMNLPKTSQ